MNIAPQIVEGFKTFKKDHPESFNWRTIGTTDHYLENRLRETFIAGAACAEMAVQDAVERKLVRILFE